MELYDTPKKKRKKNSKDLEHRQCIIHHDSGSGYVTKFSEISWKVNYTFNFI